MSWFDITQLDNKTYVISENHHYEETNIYYLIGDNFNICIDSGMGLHKIRKVLEEIDSKEIYIITTHSHWDHIGNHDEFTDVYLHKNAKKNLKNGGLTSLSVVKQEMIRGVDKKYTPENFDIDNYKIYDGINGIEIEDGELINLGNRELEIIYTPGHTNDSISIFDKFRGYLFVGDFLYSGRLYCSSKNNKPIEYYNSLKKLLKKDYQISRVLSGHYVPDLGKDYVKKTYDLFHKIGEDGKLKQGTGIHQFEGIEVEL